MSRFLTIVVATILTVAVIHAQDLMVRRPHEYLGAGAATETTPAAVTVMRHLQANNDSLVCPSGSDRLAQEAAPVLTTLCPSQCAADNLCIYFPANTTSACATTAGRQCVQGEGCAFECVANPKAEFGWYLSLYTDEEVIQEVHTWNNAFPPEYSRAGLAVAINATLVRKFVGGFNPSIHNVAIFFTGNEAANDLSEFDVFGTDMKVFPRGEIVPFEVPATIFETMRGFERIKLENVRFNEPPSNVSLKFPILFFMFLRNAGLTSVPFGNASCPRLLGLDLSVNGISELTQLPNPKGLANVNLSSNAITTIPKGLITPSMTYLILDSNPLKEIPVGTLPPTMTSLYISDTMLVEVPEDIANMSALVDLFMSHNAFRVIPDNSLPVDKTTYVEVNNCSLTSIPTAFTPMKQLKELFMSHNNFSSNANFSVLPTTIQRLEIRYSNLQTIDAGLQLQSGLQYLDISGNPEAMNSLSQSNIPGGLLSLILEDNKLKTVPPVVQTLTKLQKLNLMDNPMEKILPGELPSRLSTFSMRRAKVRSFSLKTFPSLVNSMVIHDSLLEEAPEDIRSMEKLQSVQIVRCRLVAFDVADRLPTLKNVQLTGNQLTRFSGSYPAAILLDLRDNRIGMFNVTSAPNLESLQLGNNNMTSMPQAIFDLPKLFILNLTGNPIRDFSPTDEQIKFLSKVPNVRMSQEMFSTGCAENDQARLHGFTVCKSVAPVEEVKAEVSSSKTSVALIVGNVLLGLVLCLLVLVWWRRRQRQKQREKDLTSQTASLGEHLLDESIWTDSALLQHRLDASVVKNVRLLGSGVGGEVWLASYRSELVAVKTLKTTDAVSLQHFVAEIKLVLTLSHPRIVEMIGVVWTKESDLALVTEYMAGGDLRAHLDATAKTRDGWTTQELQIALEITEAVVYLHSLDPIVIHRDLKSRNVLLDTDGHAKITDFGISRLLIDNETMTADVGTMRWIAPEVLAGKRYTESADIFSLGVILSEIDTHALPFEGALDDTGTQVLSETAIAARLVSGSIKCTFSDSCPSELRSLAERCTAFDAESRPTGLQVAYELRTLLRSK